MSSNLFWLKYGKKRGTIILSNLNEIRGCLLTFLSPQTFLKKREFSASAPTSNLNGDFTPSFLTL